MQQDFGCKRAEYTEYTCKIPGWESKFSTCLGKVRNSYLLGAWALHGYPGWECANMHLAAFPPCLLSPSPFPLPWEDGAHPECTSSQEGEGGWRKPAACKEKTFPVSLPTHVHVQHGSEEDTADFQLCRGVGFPRFLWGNGESIPFG